MKKMKLRKLVSLLAAVVMVVAMIPAVGNSATAQAAEGDTTSSGIELSKTATLEDDGTYTIDLEAYATGETTTTTVTSGVPLDIVLVIDQSGSMENSITGSTTYTARNSASYTYNGYNTTYYYLAEDGNYYAVSRGRQSTGSSGGGYGPGQGNQSYQYYLYYTDANGDTVYLSGTGTTTTQPTNVTNNNTTIWTGVLYTATTTSTTKLAALKTAVTNFVTAISKNAAETGADHRIAIAGFACGDNSDMSGYQNGSWNWLNTGLFIGGSLTNYATQGSSATSSSLTAQNYKDALVSVNDANGNVASSITTAISNFQAEGATFTSYGMEMANNVFANNSATYTKDDGTEGTRQRIVVVFTDGAPGYSGYTDAEAGAAVNYSYTAKNTYSATVYTVGLYASSDETDNVKAFMNYLSSNYPSAQYNTSSSSWSAGTQASSKYYMTTNDATELNNIFTTISSEATSSSTTVTLDANSVMKDIMGDGFTLADDFDVDTDVTIKTVAGSVDAETGEIVWGAETENSAEASVSGNTVSVTGFNYADKYISSSKDGEKICVTIKGVVPTVDVITDKAVNTNAATSGIYADANTEEPAATFEQPQTIITKKLYVLDYAKTAELTDLDQNSSVTGIVSGYQKVTSANSFLNQSYGKSDLSDNTLTYTPTTMSWNGYDSLYVFGQTTNETIKGYSANSNGNLWSKVSVIPANNVYYEDDFVTSDSTGTVGIVYKGTWTEVGTTDGNTETANGSTYGWETSLADDATYSDGSAHSTSASMAQATFTFTGTGVDIYSKTDLTTGTVVAYLTGTAEGSEVKISKTLIVDNLAESNGETGYYQIPTVSLNTYENSEGEEVALPYGTYTVTLTVTTAAADRSTYYIDGIRVYNPLGTVTEADGDAYTAYSSDNELNAVFTEVRDILINDVQGYSADSSVTGAVFIDEINGEKSITTGTLTDYETYGPENEVYLGKDQAIVFHVDATGNYTYYLGLKAPSGNSTTAEVTNGDSKSSLNINAASDLYYEITPDENGYIMVQNTGDNLLSITKLRTTTTTVSAADGISTASLDELVTYANSFSLLSTVAYTDDVVDEEELDTNINTDAENDDAYEDMNEDDIVIDNPAEDTEGETEGNDQQSIFSNLFNTIRNWFNGRR